MKRTGVFGGSFDPPHFGHMITARFVAEQLDLEKIIIVPTNRQPMKLDELQASPAQRMEMVQRICYADDLFEPSDIEINRPEISYTYKTLEAIKDQNGSEVGLFWIMGADAASGFLHWKNSKRILELAHLAIMVRRGNVPEKIELPDSESYSIIYTPRIDISSTEIRSRIREGLPVTYWVGEKVTEYIRENGLYL